MSFLASELFRNPRIEGNGPGSHFSANSGDTQDSTTSLADSIGFVWSYKRSSLWLPHTQALELAYGVVCSPLIVGEIDADGAGTFAE